MNNGQLPAAPLHNDELVKAFMEVEQVAPNGLTKREHFAGLIMQGIVTSKEANFHSESAIAEQAVSLTDALLKELAK